MASSMATKKVNIFLEDGKITEVKTESVEKGYQRGLVLVAESKKNRLIKLRLYSIDYGKFLENFDVNEALIKAFDYSNSYDGKSNFSKEAETLRDFFIKNVDNSSLSKDERIEIKKFMFLTYIQAKQRNLL